jgi:hypothetical protein
MGVILSQIYNKYFLYQIHMFSETSQKQKMSLRYITTLKCLLFNSTFSVHYFHYEQISREQLLIPFTSNAQTWTKMKFVSDNC